MKTNYDKIMQESISRLDKRERLLLHACCAPCSSAVLERLSPHFDITLFFYNPNMDGEEEYNKRASELIRLVKETGNAASVIIPPFEPLEYQCIVKGLENEKEGGLRCHACYRLRLKKTAEYAKEHGFEKFTTTLSISPHKNADIINSIGLELEKEISIPFLVADFKKRGGFKRSIELSKQYGLYRQNYCGCVYSKRARLEND